MILVLLSGVLITYFTGAIFYFVGNKTGKAKLQRIALISTIIGCMLNGIILVLRWKLTGRLPLASGSEFLLCFSFFTVIMYLIYEWKSREKKTGSVVMLIVTVLMLSVVGLMADHLAAIQPLMPALKSPWLSVHVLTAAFAYAAFALAAGLAAKNIIKKEYTQHGESICSIVSGGFAMLSISIVLGAIWAEQTWGSYWSWDPKETWALVTWIIYALYLHLHKRQNWQGKRANIMVLTGFILVLFTFFGVNYLMSGLHSYA